MGTPGRSEDRPVSFAMGVGVVGVDGMVDGDSHGLITHGDSDKGPRPLTKQVGLSNAIRRLRAFELQR